MTQPLARPVAGSVRILGIDPGSIATGFGAIDLCAGSTSVVGWGTIRTAGDHSARLREIFMQIGQVVEQYRPAEIAIERVFLHRNADSALKLGQARAAALCATFGDQLPIFEYSARHIKKAVVGQGGAAKEQVQRMVRMLLGLQDEVEPDAADALAAALCHAHQRGTRDLVRRAASGP